MNDLKVFENSEFGKLEVLMIDSKEYFPATRCAKILGYANPRDAIKKHCKIEGVAKCDGVSETTNQYGTTTSQATEIKYIDEGNLYRLIIRSKLPSAEKFERWVMEDVLPSIRKTGSYGNINIEEIINKTATAVAVAVCKQLLNSGYATQTTTIINNYPIKNNQLSKIEKLSSNLKTEVDKMLSSNLYSHQVIADFITDNGFPISQVAVSKYKRKHFGFNVMR